MTPSLLLTQCLQNDFVKPIGRFDPVPNKLHVGFAEARRLLGENPAEGPVARLMCWAYGVPDEELRVIHLRDWHDEGDPAQREHLELFGSHCLKGTPGAAFAFDPPRAVDKDIVVVDSTTLNDFAGTRLAEVLAPYAGRSVRVGLVGVWTEAKVAFLAYELCTRYPRMQVAVCSALCASSSRQHHFDALDHLARILGVTLFDSLGKFIDFLGGDAAEAPLIGASPGYPALEAGEGSGLCDDDEALVRYLFRDCKRVGLRLLDGGFSGNVVAAAESVDLHGHEQVPHVVKIGPRELMGRERAAFERVQHVLGNSAPLISDFADLGARGAIKYRYASMSGAAATTFQKAFMRGMPEGEVRRVLDTVFVEQLGRFYRAAQLESADLLEHYGFRADFVPSVERNVAAVLGREPAGPTLELLPGVVVDNVARLYEEVLVRAGERPRDSFYQSVVHGDLNGANIILDGHGNVWLIDFFHTRRAHALMDLVKLENDLCYIFTPVADDDALARAFALTDRLLAHDDLGAPLPEARDLDGVLGRTWEALRVLRGYHAAIVQTDRDPLQLWVAQLRYALHTLSFDESTALQKRWALYAACRCASLVARELRRSSRLRVDWVHPSVGMTLLPGRRDHDRSLARDLDALQAGGVTHVVTLITADELSGYGVPALLDDMRARGLSTMHMPVLDQKACSLDDMGRVVRFLDDAVATGGKAVVHCLGGLGRSGMAVASWLRARGLSADDALAEVRRARSPRAVETRAQEDFVRGFTRH